MKKCAVFIISFLLVSMFIITESALALSYGSGIDVDGLIDDWDLSLTGEDFFANMYLAGDEDKDILSYLYLRYDCSTNYLYALVLDYSKDTATPDASADDAWIKIYDDYLGWSNDKLIDGDGEGNTKPLGFEWVYGNYTETKTLQGYEAYAYLDEGTYDAFEAHLNIDGDTSSTGKKNPISLEIDCPDCPDNPETPVPEPATMILFGVGLIGLAGFARRKIQK